MRPWEIAALLGAFARVEARAYVDDRVERDELRALVGPGITRTDERANRPQPNRRERNTGAAKAKRAKMSKRK